MYVLMYKTFAAFTYVTLHWLSTYSKVPIIRPVHTANAYRQTTDKLMFESVISTVRWVRK